MNRKVAYNTTMFQFDCIQIAHQLVVADYEPDYWIALDRGGVIPAATIRREYQNLKPNHKAHFLIKHKDDDWAQLLTTNVDLLCEKKILLIDDIVDFGLQYQKSIRAFDEIKQDLAAINNHDPTTPKDRLFMPRTKHAALIWNISNQCNIRADFYGRTIDKAKNPEDNAWIKFWWEND